MRRTSRRELLRRAGGAALGVALAGCRTPRAPIEPPSPVSAEPAAPAPLPAPDLADARVLRFVAGVRPYGRGGVRVELELLGDRTLVHDYGHGGAGITLAWGSANEVLTSVEPDPARCRRMLAEHRAFFAG